MSVIELSWTAKKVGGKMGGKKCHEAGGEGGGGPTLNGKSHENLPFFLEHFP